RILGAAEFVEPDFSNLYKNYDNDADKIAKVLKLLETEFETYIKRTEAVVKSKDQEEWESILHKLIAHINNLKLGSLEALPKDVELLDNDLNRIKNVFVYYLCCFRVEGYFNSKGGFFLKFLFRNSAYWGGGCRKAQRYCGYWNFFC